MDVYFEILVVAQPQFIQRSLSRDKPGNEVMYAAAFRAPRMLAYWGAWVWLPTTAFAEAFNQYFLFPHWRHFRKYIDSRCARCEVAYLD